MRKMYTESESGKKELIGKTVYHPTWNHETKTYSVESGVVKGIKDSPYMLHLPDVVVDVCGEEECWDVYDVFLTRQSVNEFIQLSIDHSKLRDRLRSVSQAIEKERTKVRDMLVEERPQNSVDDRVYHYQN